VLHYLKLTLLPGELCLNYNWPPAESWIRTLPALLPLAGLVLLAVWGIVRGAPAGYALGWVFITLLPTSSILPLEDAAFEHRMYLPLAAVVVLVVCLAHMLVVRRLRPAARAAVAIAVVVAVAGGLGYRTARRNADYHDKEHMWREVVRCSPKNPRGHNNLGLALLESNRPSEAAACFKRALEADPTYAQAGQNLVIARSWAKDPGRAAEYLEAWLEQHPGSPVACQNLAVLLDKQGRLEEAIALYRQAIRLRRNYPQAHSQLGSALARLGCDAEAIKSLTKAIELRPHYADGHYNIGVFHARRGNSDQAQVHLQKALRLDSGHVGAHCAMGGIRLGQGHFEDAAACFARATELTGGPDRVRPLLGLALALAGGGDGSAAVARYRQVLAIDADNPLANNGLARLLATWPDPQIRNGAEAVRLAKKACQAVDNPDHAYLDTLAAAQAEIGQFDEAVRTMQQAISLVTQAGNTQAAKSYAAHLQLYQTGQCLREIPRQ